MRTLGKLKEKNLMGEGFNILLAKVEQSNGYGFINVRDKKTLIVGIVNYVTEVPTRSLLA